jgi:sterol desaturase/sphingolipid hydroxylase (fatty acid hydroxylase superfamily)
MDLSFLSSTIMSSESAALVKRGLPIVLLALFWSWESWRPFFGRRDDRWKHAGRNLSIALLNTLILGVVFGGFTVTVAEWAQRNQYGLLHALGLATPIRFVLALIFLDAWMYVWHWANHAIPQLWRFHRMHHSDRSMDVTTATRFHLGEHVGSSLLRLGLIPVLGFELWDLVAYDTVVLAITHFHHADISIGRLDRWLRWVIVTPFMHKVHHSDCQLETDSNYSTVLSIWDRLAGTFRMRSDVKTIVFGLDEFSRPSWQTCWGMWKTPFVNDPYQDSITVPQESELRAKRGEGTDDYQLHLIGQFESGEH